MNFLENPNWIVLKKNRSGDLTIENDHGIYILKMSDATHLPNRLDKMILYFLLHKIFKNENSSNEVIVSRYEIVKNVLIKDENFSKTKYERIINSLERWKSVNIKFEGNFYEKNIHTYKE